MLSDSLLRALADDSWSLLDLSGCVMLTASGIAAVAPKLPKLQALDVSGTLLGSQALRALALHCSEIHTIRLGGNPTADRAATMALRHVLPQWRPQALVADSWEEEEQAEEAHRSLEEPGRWYRLRYIVWPEASPKVLERVASQHPGIAVNVPPGVADRHGRRPPAAADRSVPLDQPLADLVAPGEWSRPGEAAMASGGDGAVVPIAERFRRAYEEQATRLWRKQARNEAAWHRRQLRNSSAMRVLDGWLDEQ